MQLMNLRDTEDLEPTPRSEGGPPAGGSDRRFPRSVTEPSSHAR